MKSTCTSMKAYSLSLFPFPGSSSADTPHKRERVSECVCVCVHACVRVHACDGSRKGKSAAKDGRKGKAATKTAKELAQQPKARKPQGHCTGCPWKSNRKTTSAFVKCDDWICRNHTFTLQNMRIQMKHV